MCFVVVIVSNSMGRCRGGFCVDSGERGRTDRKPVGFGDVKRKRSSLWFDLMIEEEVRIYLCRF